MFLKGTQVKIIQEKIKVKLVRFWKLIEDLKKLKLNLLV